MKKLGLLFKETSEELIKNNLKESESVFVINYSKISSQKLSNLRRSLRNTNACLFVVKNSVARRALKGLGLDRLVKAIEGPCGLVFIKEDPMGASRVLYDFSRDHPPLELQGGFLKDRILEPKDIEVMARLPSREVLRACVVMALNSPILGLVVTLNQVLKKFVCCLEQIKQKIATTETLKKD